MNHCAPIITHMLMYPTLRCAIVPSFASTTPHCVNVMAHQQETTAKATFSFQAFDDFVDGGTWLSVEAISAGIWFSSTVVLSDPVCVTTTPVTSLFVRESLSFLSSLLPEFNAASSRVAFAAASWESVSLSSAVYDHPAQLRLISVNIKPYAILIGDDSPAFGLHVVSGFLMTAV